MKASGRARRIGGACEEAGTDPGHAAEDTPAMESTLQGAG